jgi:hypothetical protein
MAVITGFQVNSKLSAGLWIYKPDPAVDRDAKEIVVNLNLMQYYEATANRKAVWIFYGQTNISTSQAPYKLEGAAAQSFLAAVDALFTGPITKPQFDVASSLNGTLTPGFVLLTFPFTTTVTFPANLPNSQGVVGIAPSSNAVFTIAKNGIPFGTMTFPAGELRAVFASAADVIFTQTPQISGPPVADVLTLIAPNPADGTLADIGFALSGTVVS